jgi:type IV pilus assembly protein PilP
MRKSILYAATFAMLGAAAIAGCSGGGGGGGGGKAKAAKKGAAAADAGVSVAAADAPKAYAGPEYIYQYNPVGKRDPFRSPMEDNTQDKQQTGRTLCSEPLCQWELDQLTLVAVVTGDASPIAMVEDPGGRGHIIRRNTRIGKQDGRVTQILRDSVIVTQYFTGPDGKTKPNPVSMNLKQDVASVPPTDLLTGQPYQ